MDEYPTSAFVSALAARTALHRGEVQRAHEFLARAQRLRPRLTYALPSLAIQTRLELARAYLTIADAGGAATVLSEIEALLRRQPDLGTLRSVVDELRASLNFEAGGDIAANLGALYDYCSRQLMKASLENRGELLDEVATLIRELRGAWIALPPQSRAALP